MFLVLFILFVLQHQIECNSGFRHPPDNRAFLNRLKNELQVKNDDIADVASGGAKSNAKSNANSNAKSNANSNAKSNANSNAKSQGLAPDRVAPAQTAADAFRKNIDFNDERREAKPAAYLRAFDDLSKDTPAPLGPVFSNRLKLKKRKPREREYEPQPSTTPLAPTASSLGKLFRAQRPSGIAEELEQRKAQLNAELADAPQMRVGVGVPDAVLAYASSNEKDHELALDVPDANMLDMAHAVGGELPNLRNQNRLCSRHVLIPEGPKYDSKGAIYLPAFSPKTPKGTATTRDYASTRAPHLLLPKCCNCCKKSVLGCE